MPRQFDAISYAQDLEAAGVPKAQADVHAKALAHVISDCAVSPADLAAVENRLKCEIAEIKTQLRTLKWMNGITLALVLALYPLVLGLYVSR